MTYPFCKQLDAYDCGPACLKMLAEFFGKTYPLDFLREECFLTREGVSLLGITQAAEKIGFHTLMAKATLPMLKEDCPLPAILYWNQEHFVVLYKVYRPRLSFKAEPVYIIADPEHGIRHLCEADFKSCWLSDNGSQGICVLLEPTAAFYERHATAFHKRNELKRLLAYLRPFRRQLSGLVILMCISLAMTTAFPYLAKGLVDKGILGKNHHLITIFSFSQLILYCSSSVFDIIRNRMLLNVNAKISLNIISDFLKKLFQLPIRFFDSKSVGDVAQRITDHQRIESFLTGEMVNTAFSVIQIILFSGILFSYRINLWLVFTALSVLGVIWILLFQKKRRQLDYIRFTQSKNTQEKLFEMVIGMQEIKLFSGESAKRWEWEFLQMRQFRLNLKSLRLEQLQQSGFTFITYFKNTLLSFIAASLVLKGDISLGVMLSVSFIIGQTNGPLQQLVQFFKSAQDARLSFSRLQEVHDRASEEDSVVEKIRPAATNSAAGAITLRDVSFQYQGPRSPYVLRNIDITIPKKRITAIVGASGSGKTTLLKLLLGFYSPTEGEISVGEDRLDNISPSLWRSKCGTVMQDGYIFNDSIRKNITMGRDESDNNDFERAVSVSNVREFAESFPLKYNTRIGASGLGLSGGQKQRVLIARSVYKDPDYLFFDEATSSLDANNETEIINNLAEFFIGKTVVVIAHRLSTVKNADQIIVLDKGRVVEAGDHRSLTEQRGKYYALIKDQLELGA
jgi:ATP-binding cassette subfamily B protein